MKSGRESMCPVCGSAEISEAPYTSVVSGNDGQPISCPAWQCSCGAVFTTGILTNAFAEDESLSDHPE